MFSAWASLSVNHSLRIFLFLDAYRFTRNNFLRPDTPFLGTFLSVPSLHLGKHWVHLSLVHTGPFFPVFVVFCTVITIVYICPLWMFWSWWIPMVRSYRFLTLSWGLCCCIQDHPAVRDRVDIQLGTRDQGYILQPPARNPLIPRRGMPLVLLQTIQPVPPEQSRQGDPETGGLLTETVLRSYEEQKRETRTRMSHFG